MTSGHYEQAGFLKIVRLSLGACGGVTVVSGATTGQTVHCRQLSREQQAVSSSVATQVLGWEILQDKCLKISGICNNRLSPVRVKHLQLWSPGGEHQVAAQFSGKAVDSGAWLVISGGQCCGLAIAGLKTGKHIPRHT